MATVEFATLDGVTLQDLSINANIGVTEISGLSGLPAIRGSENIIDIPVADGVIEPPNQYFGARYSTWNIDVFGSTVAAARANWTALMLTLGAATRAQKQLRWRWVGDTLALQADVRVSAMTSPVSNNTKHGARISFQVIFRHADPTNYDQTLTTLTASTGTGTLTQVATNAGDAYTWPTIVIIGPVTGAVITNAATGLAISFPGYALIAGHTLTIVTTPGKRVISETAVGDLRSKLGNTSQFPAISPGATESYGLTGTARTVATSFQLTYRSGYFS